MNTVDTAATIPPDTPHAARVPLRQHLVGGPILGRGRVDEATRSRVHEALRQLHSCDGSGGDGDEDGGDGGGGGGSSDGMSSTRIVLYDHYYFTTTILLLYYYFTITILLLYCY